MMLNWMLILAASLFGSVLTCICLLFFARPMIKRFIGVFTNILMKDPYEENIWEMVVALTRLDPKIVIENSLRATNGGVIERPFGTPRKFLNFDGLIFSPAQLATLPSHEDTQVVMQTVIGPKAKKPLTIDMPILIGAMAYGLGVSEKVRLAQAMGTAVVGTACNIGEGGFLPEERKRAKYMIVQYHSAKWGKNPEVLKQADAIEIHIGQGASAAAPARIPPETLQGEARDMLGLEPDETAVIPRRFDEINNPDDLKNLVQKLRKMTGGIPIGIKIAAGNRLEEDIEIGIQAEVDFISIDGGQAGTKGSALIIQDDFGLPTIYALTRAVQFLNNRGVKDQISLLIGGGFFTPGHCLKALALGADAVFMGTAVLWAMTHSQVTKVIPFEPPTTLAWYAGRFSEEFDEEEAAYYLANFLTSFSEEMKVAVISLGKTDVHQVNTEDLVALDQVTSDVTKVPLAYEK
ncbi:FMN-binding glutamate synthase family protein [Bacillus sp. S3]|uniref:FMN-binding glutamate synthase family protein n=1 Tax=Bacillus sp. S3 TaxID=486398 RepID=UPI001189CFC8|nr:FMN-binding glutamate synthase family protein [Bacillus sp. S3]QCJ41319.1 FMN-binding glutamate synthase family protein [Bacillus sp. S3]